jgi:hypothetical protein
MVSQMPEKKYITVIVVLMDRSNVVFFNSNSNKLQINDWFGFMVINTTFNNI